MTMSNYQLLESLNDEQLKEHYNEKFSDQEDSIHSGESKLKNFSFDPKTERCPHDVQRTIDFWKFIDTRKDLFPQRGFKLETTAHKKKKCKEHEELTWKSVLELLKANNLDKAANRGSREPCKIETCMEAAERLERNRPKDEYLLDDLGLDNLDDFDPQRVTYADAQVQTEPIVVEDKETSIDSAMNTAMVMQARLRSLDDLLKEVADADLTGYFDCICDEPCAFLPYPTASNQSIDSAGKTSPLDKCTCSCGEIGCLCSLCAEILEKIENARDSFEKLSTFEVEQCPCANLSCDCLADYRQLLDIKLEINRAVRETVQDETAVLALPMRCRCSCGQLNCPCKIVMQLFVELDELMGYKEKPLLYYDKELDMTFGADVCRCNDEYDDERCACLSYYRKQIQDKIDLQPTSEQAIVSPSTISTEIHCTGDCLDECTIETCHPRETVTETVVEDTVIDVSATGDTEKDESSNSAICECTNKECLATSITILSPYSTDKVCPATPCNSDASLPNVTKQSDE